MGADYAADTVKTVLAAAAPGATIAEWAVVDDEYPVMTPSTEALARIVATTTDGRRVSVFVKTLRSIRHWPMFEIIPEPLRDAAVAGFPWHVEADVYGSGLLSDLPDGLRPPRVFLIDELGDDRTRLWMEDAAAPPAAWDLDRYRTAARALGRLAGRFPADRLPAGLPPLGMGLRAYYRLRVESTALPALRDDRTWDHPLMRPGPRGRPGPPRRHARPHRRRAVDPRPARPAAADPRPLGRLSAEPARRSGASRRVRRHRLELHRRRTRRLRSRPAPGGARGERRRRSGRAACHPHGRSSPHISTASPTRAPTPIPPTFAADTSDRSCSVPGSAACRWSSWGGLVSRESRTGSPGGLDTPGSCSTCSPRSGSTAHDGRRAGRARARELDRLPDGRRGAAPGGPR